MFQSEDGLAEMSVGEDLHKLNCPETPRTLSLGRTKTTLRYTCALVNSKKVAHPLIPGKFRDIAVLPTSKEQACRRAKD